MCIQRHMKGFQTRIQYKQRLSDVLAAVSTLSAWYRRRQATLTQRAAAAAERAALHGTRTRAAITLQSTWRGHWTRMQNTHAAELHALSVFRRLFAPRLRLRRRVAKRKARRIRRLKRTLLRILSGAMEASSSGSSSKALPPIGGSATGHVQGGLGGAGGMTAALQALVPHLYEILAGATKHAKSRSSHIMSPVLKSTSAAGHSPGGRGRSLAVSPLQSPTALSGGGLDTSDYRTAPTPGGLSVRSMGAFSDSAVLDAVLRDTARGSWDVTDLVAQRRTVVRKPLTSNSRALLPSERAVASAGGGEGGVDFTRELAAKRRAKQAKRQAEEASVAARKAAVLEAWAEKDAQRRQRIKKAARAKRAADAQAAVEQEAAAADAVAARAARVAEMHKQWEQERQARLARLRAKKKCAAAEAAAAVDLDLVDAHGGGATASSLAKGASNSPARPQAVSSMSPKTSAWGVSTTVPRTRPNTSSKRDALRQLLGHIRATVKTTKRKQQVQVGPSSAVPSASAADIAAARRRAGRRAKARRAAQAQAKARAAASGAAALRERRKAYDADMRLKRGMMSPAAVEHLVLPAAAAQDAAKRVEEGSNNTLHSLQAKPPQRASHKRANTHTTESEGGSDLDTLAFDDPDDETLAAIQGGAGGGDYDDGDDFEEDFDEFDEFEDQHRPVSPASSASSGISAYSDDELTAALLLLEKEVPSKGGQGGFNLNSLLSSLAQPSMVSSTAEPPSTPMRGPVRGGRVVVTPLKYSTPQAQSMGRQGSFDSSTGPFSASGRVLMGPLSPAGGGGRAAGAGGLQVPSMGSGASTYRAGVPDSPLSGTSRPLHDMAAAPTASPSSSWFDPPPNTPSSSYGAQPVSTFGNEAEVPILGALNVASRGGQGGIGASRPPTHSGRANAGANSARLPSLRTVGSRARKGGDRGAARTASADQPLLGVSKGGSLVRGSAEAFADGSTFDDDALDSERNARVPAMPDTPVGLSSVVGNTIFHEILGKTFAPNVGTAAAPGQPGAAGAEVVPDYSQLQLFDTAAQQNAARHAARQRELVELSARGEEGVEYGVRGGSSFQSAMSAYGGGIQNKLTPLERREAAWDSSAPVVAGDAPAAWSRKHRGGLQQRHAPPHQRPRGGSIAKRSPRTAAQDDVEGGFTPADMGALRDPASQALARMLSPGSAAVGGGKPSTGGGVTPDMNAALSALVGGGTRAQAAVAQASSRMKPHHTAAGGSAGGAVSALDLVGGPAGKPGGDDSLSPPGSSPGKKRKKHKKKRKSEQPRAPKTAAESPPNNALEVMHSLT